MVARFVMKFKKQRIISIIAVVTMAIVLSFVFVACNKTDGKDPGDKDLIEPPKKELSASEIYSQVNPSVAFVLIENLSGYSSGSGFFIDSNGTLITNYHVIDDGLSGAIQLYDGTVATIDSVIGYDKNLDIAILSTSAKNTSPVKIADSIIQIGETVYAIGYPEAFKLGFSSSTFTSGMVSMNRSIEGYSYIQSTVNITHGNSGGALINKYGEVVGITTSGITYANIDYMNLSIPIQRIDTVSRTANEPLVIVTRRKYPVYATFYSDGAKYTTQTLSYEGRASVPTAPVKAGYTLDGWYADSSFTEKFDFNKKITSDVSIYAKWRAVDENIRNYKLRQTANGYIITDVIDKTVSKVIIPDVIVGIDDGAFSACTKIKTIIGNATNVSTVAKQTKSSSFSVNITSGTSINDYVFSGCTGLTSVTIGNSVTSISKSAFSNCKGLTSIIVGKENTKYHSAGNCLIETATKTLILGCKTSVIPTDDSLTSIGNYAFYGCTELTSVTIPDSVTSIGNYAFYKCIGLTSVTIPDSVTSIGNSAFYGCTGLTSITIPDSVTSIGSSAFSSCNKLQDIYITDIAAWCNISELDNLMYYGSSNKKLYINNELATSITIPNGVTTIPSYAFSGCTGLTNVTIPDSVTSIGSSAFRDCTGLTSITIPDSVTSVGSSAFCGCTGLTSIVIPDRVTSIGSSAFSGCTGLTTVNWNAVACKSAGSSGYSIFSNCFNLATVNIGANVKIIPSSAFSNCKGLTSVTIPDSVTSIGYEAFSNCKGLTSVTIGNGVTSIGGSAFFGCSGLTSVTIGNSVKSIGQAAFSYCTGLTSITFNGTIAQWNAISKGDYWKNKVRATEVVCTDGKVSI